MTLPPRLRRTLALASGLLATGCATAMPPREPVPNVPPAATTSSAASLSSEAQVVISSSAMSQTTSSAQKAPVAASAYMDGSYEAEGDYKSPAGPESIDVSLTLKGDVVTAVSVTGTSESGKSQKYIDQFVAGVQTVVVGKPLSELSLGVVNGSSLTPKGFMDALAKIKAEAQA